MRLFSQVRLISSLKTENRKNRDYYPRRTSTYLPFRLHGRAGDEAGTKSAALLVLMSTLENASHPKALANLAKHFAFTRCGELNFNGVVEAQIALFESELLADNTLVS